MTIIANIKHLLFILIFTTIIYSQSIQNRDSLNNQVNSNIFADIGITSLKVTGQIACGFIGGSMELIAGGVHPINMKCII